MNCLFDKIRVIDNVINDNELNHIVNLLNSSNKWNIQCSTEDNDIFRKHKFLMLALNDDNFFMEYLFKKIKKHIGDDFDVDRVYANGQYYGMPGKPHIDSHHENAYTFLIYANKIWDVLWGGQTIFFDEYVNSENLNVLISNKVYPIFPNPKMGLFFPSNIYHYAESPTKECLDFRFTIAYKLVKNEDKKKNKLRRKKTNDLYNKL